MKKCTQCKLDKEYSQFSPKGNGKYASRCKACLSKNRREAYVKHTKVVFTGEKKICIKCSVEKLLSEFYKNYNSIGYRNECKACNNQRIAEHRKELRQFSIDLKSVPCMDCNKNYPYYVMDFDHRDGNTKLYNLSQMRFCSKEKFLEEAR